MKIDEWMPEYQFSARYSIHVEASPEQTFAAVAQANFADLPIVRRLMRLRGYRMPKAKPAATPSASPLTVQTRRFGSFVELARLPPQEVVLGIAGQFWRPSGGILRDLTPEQFRDLHRDGYARAVWNFHISAADANSILSTETRVQTFGWPATLQFRCYWLIVSPFSGLMRKAMLRQVKRIAEQSSL